MPSSTTSPRVLPEEAGIQGPAIDSAISNALGHDFGGDIPGEEQISPAEFASIYKVIEKNTLETHRDEIAQQ